MARTRDVVTFLDELLHPAGFDDVAVNGLQVPGRAEVSRVVTGVSATRELVQRAVELEAGLVLVHHGLFWTFDRPGLTPLVVERLRPLLRYDVNLVGQHLPLDAHAEHGNNALLAEALGCDDHEPFADAWGHAVGRIARWDGDGIALEELVQRVARVTKRQPLLLDGGPERVRRAAIASGAAADEAAHAAALGLDALVTGEPRERTTAEAREARISVLAAGHHATETLGVQRLGELLAERFDLEHHWVDVPNPV